MRGLWLRGGWIVALALVSGCGEPPALELNYDGTVGRFVEEEASDLLDLESFFEYPVLEDLGFDSESDRKLWNLGQGEPAAEFSDDGVVIPEATARVLRRSLAMSAGDVVALEVQIAGLTRGNLRLAWRQEGERREGQGRWKRSVLLPGNSGRGDGQVRAYRFHLAGEAGWEGTIDRLFLAVRPAAGEAPVVHGLTALGRRFRSAGAWPGDQAFKVELDHEVRDAFLVPPGQEIRRAVRLAENAELRFAIGIEAAMGAAVEFRLRAQQAGEAHLLWQRTLKPRGPEAGRWIEVRVPLDELGVGSWDLILETHSEASTEGLGAWPLWAHPVLSRGSEGALGTEEDKNLNVLLISIDTLRPDRLTLYGHDRPTSPHLEAWARERAMTFERVVAASPWTLPSHLSLLSGLDAVRHGINHDVGRGPSEQAPELLAGHLRKAGYRTAAITGGGYLHPRYGFVQGFERYRYWPDRGRAQNELQEGVDRALEFLEGHRDVPFFLFLHTYDVHDPYRARSPFFERVGPPGMEAPGGEVALWSPSFEKEEGFHQENRFIHRHRGEKEELGEEDRPLLEALYDSGVAHMDAEIGRLLEGLTSLGLNERTLVVLTSDHGEALGEDGDAGHASLYDRVVLVPLLVSWPGRTTGGTRVAEQVRSIDIVPTILDGLGIRHGLDLDGVSLLPVLTGEPMELPSEAWTYAASSNRGLALRYGNRYKLMVDQSVWQPQEDRLFDLQADSLELQPLADGEGPQAELRRRLEEYFEEEAVGLRLRVANEGPGILKGRLEGAMVRPVATKSVDLDCRCLAWEEMGVASFEVPPGKAFTLSFEKIFGRHLRLRGALDLDGERDRFDHTFTVDALDEPEALEWREGTWTTRNGGGEEGPGTGFLTYWRGARQQHDEGPAAEDSALRRQLEALGYL